MGCKAVETICNINNTFGPRTYNAVMVHEVLQRRQKLEDEFNGWPSEVDKQLREIIKADPLTTTQDYSQITQSGEDFMIFLKINSSYWNFMIFF